MEITLKLKNIKYLDYKNLKNFAEQMNIEIEIQRANLYNINSHTESDKPKNSDFNKESLSFKDIDSWIWN